MHREFAVAPLGRWAVLGLWLPLALAIAVVVGASLMDRQQTSASALWLSLPFVIAIGVGLSLALRRRRIVLENRDLQITATLYRKRVPVEAIDLDKARVVSLEEHTELKPMMKTNGFNLPGFSAGHYRMRNLGKAFCLVTDRTRVLALPLREGPMLLLSPEKPRELLDQLRELAGPAARR